MFNNLRDKSRQGLDKAGQLLIHDACQLLIIINSQNKRRPLTYFPEPQDNRPSSFERDQVIRANPIDQGFP